MNTLIISDTDRELIKDFKLCFDESNGYFRLHKGNKRIYLHRYLMDAKKGDIVDHIDRNKCNNKRDNLRIVSKSLNNYNKDIINPLGRGIYFDKAGNRYRACISFNDRTLKLGSFKNINDAKLKYNEKSLEIYGNDAYQHLITF